MLSDGAKRTISFAVFGSGIFAGLWACGASLQPIFTLGANDTLPGILALLLAFDTPFWACILALWHRKIAGCWLVLVGLYVPFGIYSEMFSERVYGPPRHASAGDYRDYLLICLTLSVPLLLVGLFGIMTERWDWPKPLP